MMSIFVQRRSALLNLDTFWATYGLKNFVCHLYNTDVSLPKRNELTVLLILTINADLRRNYSFDQFREM